MRKLGRHVFLAAVLLHSVACADTPTEQPTALSYASISSVPPVSTCRSKEINYITHTLPQQCLKSRPTTPPGATAANATASVEGRHSASDSATTVSDAAGADGTAVQTTSTSTQSPASSGESGEASPMGSQSAAGSVQPSATAAQSGSQPLAEPEAEAEADSPLDNANFLSFEEWKKQNLAKAGQSPENVGQGRGTAGVQGRKPRPVNINNELDFLGEDTEIELDFGFGNKADRAAALSASGDVAKEVAEDDAARELSQRPRSKDAGKTCKERFNYASFDCAATVLKTNSQCKSSSSLLVENKDSYMLNECAAENKFVIVELCDDILVDTIVLANFEFFSSMFRQFRVSVSDRYPVKLERWKELGTFEARNSRDIQAFLVENPLIWARYLRIEFLSHYGNEFYCPVSLLRVHGTTMMEEFRHQEEAARGDDDMDEVMESEEIQAMPAIQPDAQEPVPIEVSPAEPLKAAEPTVLSDATSGGAGESTLTESTNQDVHTAPTADDRLTSEDSTTSVNDGVAEGGTNQTNSQPASTITPSGGPDSVDSPPGNVHTSHNQTGAEKPEHAPTSTDSSQADTGNSGGSSQDATTAPTVTSTESDQKPTPPAKDGSNVAADGTSTRSGQSGEGTKTSTTQPQNAVPTTQESFFKSIHKRLQMLESNSTLSLQYIEDQSRILRDAFSKVEKRQLGKTEKFLDQLNSTVMAELREFVSFWYTCSALTRS